VRAKDLTRQWPLELPNSRTIAAYIESTSASYVDTEMIEELYHGSKAVLRELPVAKLKFGNAEGNIKIAKKQAKYDRMNVASQPPIVVDGDKVVDGNHRLRSAKKADLQTIKAYVIL
jgi:hypothetical protein